MKKLTVTQPMLPLWEDFLREIQDLWETHQLANEGPKHQRLQKALQMYLSCPPLLLFSHGHQALECAWEALALEGEVITTPYTFSSTTHALVRKGLKPVFCDVCPEDATMDASLIEALITPDTVAIFPVHVYGHVCDVEAIGRLAQRYHLKVIYDAAHAFGVEYQNKSIACYGDITMFSFHATKVFHTLEGGALVCAEDEVLKRLALLRNFGIEDQEHVVAVGTNAKMNEMQAAMGLCNLNIVDQEMAKRKVLAEQYERNVRTMQGIDLFRRRSSKHNYAYMPVLVQGTKNRRDAVFTKLRDEGILVRKYFYPLTSEFACYHQESYAATPIAKSLSERVLALPLYGDLTLDEVDWVCYSLQKALGPNTYGS